MRQAQKSATRFTKSRRPSVTPGSSRGGANAGITAPPPDPSSMAGNNAKKGFNAIKGKGKIAMGLGAAVVGGLAYSGRRGEGSSGGRTGMTRY
jgi:hypothetical protein